MTGLIHAIRQCLQSKDMSVQGPPISSWMVQIALCQELSCHESAQYDFEPGHHWDLDSQSTLLQYAETEVIVPHILSDKVAVGYRISVLASGYWFTWRAASLEGWSFQPDMWKSSCMQVFNHVWQFLPSCCINCLRSFIQCQHSQCLSWSSFMKRCWTEWSPQFTIWERGWFQHCCLGTDVCRAEHLSATWYGGRSVSIWLALFVKSQRGHVPCGLFKESCRRIRIDPRLHVCLGRVVCNVDLWFGMMPMCPTFNVWG